MPRHARVIRVGRPHHLTHRGNHRGQIFFSDADRRFYLSLITDRAPHLGVLIHAWCLMSNHVHWIGTPESETALSRLFGYAHGEYARYRNRLRRTTGHLLAIRPGLHLS